MSSIPQNHSDEKALVDCGLCQVFVGIFSVSVIHEEKFASRAPLLLTNAQK